MKRALDISKHQSSFMARVAKLQDIDVVICRCAYATSKDIKWDTFAPAVKAAGMELYAYGFLTAHYASKNSYKLSAAQAVMREQVNTWIQLCKEQGCNVLAVDQELEGGQIMGLNNIENNTLLIEACKIIEKAGLTPVIYCSASWAKYRIDLDRVKYPLWIAYYYNDPKDPDFDGCTPIQNVATTYGRWMNSLGNQLFGWQFGRIGFGSKYGVGSANVDKNFIYKEDKPMYTSDTLKIGPVSGGDRNTIRTLAESLAVKAVDDGDYIIVGPMSNGDRNTVSSKALELSLGCEDYTAATDPVEPEVLETPETPEVKGLLITGLNEKHKDVLISLVNLWGGNVTEK